MWVVLAVMVAFSLGLMLYDKKHFYKIRSSSEILQAEVIEFRWERGPFRNDYTKLCYSYVRILQERNVGLVKLKYANNKSEPFEIGEVIDVFWHNNSLLYYRAFDTGWMKFIPVLREE
ncbi:hypothetical protein [Rufibacter tibetensis]|uniref:DUF3592 domain-containing protein n=1 Tax=Rufibacter tibetensis TaxID=512763 RepID=A0A0P0CMT2_9BACT|nr:hypothetical protein [Rufibacter tibetensis]ALI98313.1 hypothetical protein DC20_04085 [Rufibacter tibetensis]